MQNATTLPINDSPAIIASLKFLAASNPAACLLSLPFKDKLRVLRTLDIDGIAIPPADQTVPANALLEQRAVSSWSSRGGEVFGYTIRGQSLDPLQRSNPNGLQDELIRHVQEDSTMSSFDFGIQLLDTERMTYWGKRQDANFWIENASIEWKEAEAPFHLIARLTLLPKSHLGPDAAEATYIDVTGNSTPDSTPLGSINRARGRVPPEKHACAGAAAEGHHPRTREAISLEIKDTKKSGRVVAKLPSNCRRPRAVRNQ